MALVLLCSAVLASETLLLLAQDAARGRPETSCQSSIRTRDSIQNLTFSFVSLLDRRCTTSLRILHRVFPNANSVKVREECRKSTYNVVRSSFVKQSFSSPHSCKFMQLWSGQVTPRRNAMQYFVVPWLARIISPPPPGEGAPSTAAMARAASSRRWYVIYNPTTGARPPGGVRLVITIFEIFPYCPKYSFERSVGMSCARVRPIARGDGNVGGVPLP